MIASKSRTVRLGKTFNQEGLRLSTRGTNFHMIDCHAGSNGNAIQYKVHIEGET